MIRELPEELAKIAKDELNENPERVSEDLMYVKDWIEQQPHLRARKGKFCFKRITRPVCLLEI